MKLPNPLALFRGPVTPGVLGVFGHLDATLDAVKQLKAGGRDDYTVYSPMARHEIEDAIGRPPSSVRMYVLIGGVAGGGMGAESPLFLVLGGRVQGVGWE